MIFMVLVLSGIIVGSTGLASLLMRYSLTETTAAKDSMQALFAADAGMEAVLFRRFGNCPVSNETCPDVPMASPTESERVNLSDGSFYKFRFISVDPDGNNETWFSLGRDKSGRISRALEVKFVERK